MKNLLKIFLLVFLFASSLATESHAEFKVWKKVELGTIKAGFPFIEALDQKNIEFDDNAGRIITSKFFKTNKKVLENLVVITPSELGIKGASTIQEVSKKALEHGLKFCSVEVGPQIALQHKEQLLKDARAYFEDENPMYLMQLVVPIKEELSDCIGFNILYYRKSVSLIGLSNFSQGDWAYLDSDKFVFTR